MHSYRLVGGPFDGQTFDYDRLTAVSVLHSLETASGVRVFRLLPSPKDCDRILRGEVAFAQRNGPRFPYVYAGITGDVMDLRDASGGMYLDAIKSDEERRSRKQRPPTLETEHVGEMPQESPNPLVAVLVFVAVAGYFGLGCWLPMLLEGASQFWLITQLFLVVVLGFCCGVSARCTAGPIAKFSVGVGFAAFVAVSMIAVLAPPWSGWHWLAPVVALAPLWLLSAWTGLIILAWAVFNWGYR